MSLFTVTRHEWKMSMRSRWMMIFAFLFTVLAAIILFFGNETAKSGYEGFSRMTANLLNLSLFLIPLLTLLIGSLLFSGEKEDGRLALLMTYPISPFSLIAGKYTGLFLSLSIVLLLGYSVSGILLLFFGGAAFSLLLLFFFLSLFLTMMFLSISMLIGVLANSRLHALGLGIFCWAFFVLFYEFIIMALTTMAPPNSVLPILTISVFLNPVELIRVFTVIFLGSGTVFGPTIYDFTIWAESGWGTFMFFVSCLLWTVIPLVMANILLKRGNKV
ncbi:Cu-processing system permease protein [Oikeobacillus pervagus]|uniref:Cu-processing system permease protein n=1 Tax=Oikeobacillus pervagus TaxID=1325931 RepID=A0AAJ1SZ51_9BACI|nr:ABC transporter permease subunit [Oikeobacillus pervagus]MDQ0215524.1 Cu-processing system permease protein [Oikeobacillus pervagus]